MDTCTDGSYRRIVELPTAPGASPTTKGARVLEGSFRVVGVTLKGGADE